MELPQNKTIPSCPSGHPNELYFPQIHGKYAIHKKFKCQVVCSTGTQDYLCALDVRDIATVRAYTNEADPPASLEFLQLLKLLMTTNSLDMPSNIREALDLYIVLVDMIEDFF